MTNPFSIKFFEKIKDNQVNITISISVFQYFYSDAYCKKILHQMIRTTSEQILIYDIKKKEKENKYIEIVRKRQKLSKKDFNNKYKNTPLRYYNKSFFNSFLKKKYPQLKFKFLNLPKEASDSEYGFCLKITK